MSTSNIKPPIIIRKGYTSVWTEAYNQKFRVLQCEFENFFLSITHFDFKTDSSKIIVFFYKWIQKPYIARRQLKRKSYIKRRYKTKKKIYRLKYRRGYWRRRRWRRINRRQYYQKSMLKAQKFQLSTLVIVCLENKIQSALFIKNIYSVKASLWRHPFINPLQLSKKFPFIIRSLSNPKYIGDAIVICDLFSVGICSINSLSELIGHALQHNFRRGERRRFLVLLGRLPSYIGMFDSQRKNLPIRNWNWIIKVTGKLTTSGRTSSFYIRPSFLAMHTINHHLHYSEFSIDLRPGTFSVKIWVVNHY